MGRSKRAGASKNKQQREDEQVDEEIVSPGVQSAMSTMRPSELDRPRADKTLFEQIEERQGGKRTKRSMQESQVRQRETRHGNVRIIDTGSVGQRPKSASVDGNGGDEEEDDGGIPDDEKMRLINESGILHKLQHSSAGKKQGKDKATTAEQTGKDDEDYLFHAIVYSIPFCTIYAVLDTLIHRQYNEEAPPTDVLLRLLKVAPMLFAMIYVSNRQRRHPLTRFLLPGISAAAGCYLLHLVNTSPAYGIMRQCPGVATIWIYTVFLMELLPAVGSLVGVGLFYWYTRPVPRVAT